MRKRDYDEAVAAEAIKTRAYLNLGYAVWKGKGEPPLPPGVYMEDLLYIPEPIQPEEGKA